MRLQSFGRLGLLVAVLGLSACGSTVQESFGLGKRSPDEFQVVERAPLIIPPDRRLRPPQPGTPSPREGSASQEARATLTGRPSGGSGDQSPGERALLTAAKGEADPDIRRRLLEENTQLAEVDRSTYLFILDWQRRRMQQDENVLDPVAESRRLQGEGRIVTVKTGSTPLAIDSGS